MPHEDQVESAKRVLDPQDRVAEVLFGVIMVLTYTGSLSVAQAGRDDVRAMLIGALGCNVAWGIIDGVFYLMSSVASKQSTLTMLAAVRAAPDTRAVARALPPAVAAVLEPAMLDALRESVRKVPEPPKLARLDKTDAIGALGVFLLVFLSIFPLILPFFFMHNAASAVRVSNGIALLIMAVAGAAYGRVIGRSPWAFGAGMVLLGSLLVGLVMALGG